MIKVEVTQEDIDTGKVCDKHTCPIALAYTRATGHQCSVNNFSLTDLDSGARYWLTAKAAAFVYNIDNLGPVHPFTFELSVNA